VPVLIGEKVVLRARVQSDVAVLDAELYADVETRARADSRPWRPVTPGSPASMYAVTEPSDGVAMFSAVRRADDELIGEALLWGIDTHNRLGHVGLSLRPAMRGQGYAGDVVAVLCRYGFQVLGLHRLQIETLADNTAMIATAERAGFVPEGRLRRAAWVLGEFVDEVVLGLLAEDYGSARPG
jgi:RimJ/RimL family protein N-acetyltransferase